MRVWVSLFLLLLVSCADHEVGARTEEDSFASEEGEVIVAGVSYTASTKIEFTKLGVCSELSWQKAPENNKEAEATLRFTDCSTSTPVDVDATFPIKKICGCDPITFDSAKEEPGVYKVNFTIDSGTWYLGVAASYEGKKETQRLELEVP